MSFWNDLKDRGIALLNSTGDGIEWLRSTNGSIPIRQTASDVAFPSQWYDEGLSSVASAVGVAAVTIYESNELVQNNYTVFEVVAAPTGTTPIIQAFPSLDGTNYAATPLAIINLATGAVIAGATGINAVGLYAIISNSSPLKFRKVKLTLTATAANDGAIAANAIRVLSGVI